MARRNLSDWHLFSAAALRAIGPRTMAEGRNAMRQVAALWRRRSNPTGRYGLSGDRALDKAGEAAATSLDRANRLPYGSAAYRRASRAADRAPRRYTPLLHRRPALPVATKPPRQRKRPS